MKEKSGYEIYKTIKLGAAIYHEEKHCVMMLDSLIKTCRTTTFLKKALISGQTMGNWMQQYPAFKSCYDLGMAIAKENWELEEEHNKDNADWDRKAWAARGGRYFVNESLKIRVGVAECANPWQQYMAIMKQASLGEYTATEVKLLMEAINIGTRVYETFLLQKEVDTMKQELTEMSTRNAHNIVPISKAS